MISIDVQTDQNHGNNQYPNQNSSSSGTGDHLNRDASTKGTGRNVDPLVKKRIISQEKSVQDTLYDGGELL